MMIVAIAVALPLIAWMILDDRKIRELRHQLYEKDQENKKLKLQLGDPFRSQVVDEIAFGKENESVEEPERFSVMIEALAEDTEES